jgi:hypothetical protein
MVMLSGLLLPLGWLALLGWYTVGLRSNYARLWREHDDLSHAIDQGKPAISASGDSLSDLFEYMSMAQTDYLNALEFSLVVGLIPTMILWLVIGMYGARNFSDPTFGQGILIHKVHTKKEISP